MSTPFQLREELKSMYPKSIYWKDRVDRMSDKQVLAVLFRMRQERKAKRA